jgi:hypothetical protein
MGTSPVMKNAYTEHPSCVPVFPSAITAITAHFPLADAEYCAIACYMNVRSHFLNELADKIATRQQYRLLLEQKS